jgi:hypothetical protein
MSWRRHRRATFTAADAAEASFSLPLLQHHLKAHRLERAARGVFRLVQFPPTDEEWLVPAWLWSGREGTFSHETALGSACTTGRQRRFSTRSCGERLAFGMGTIGSGKAEIPDAL